MNELQKQIQDLCDYIYKGNDITLPISVISTKLDHLEERIAASERKINDNTQMSNKVVYMFLTLLGTVLVKALIQYLTG